MGTNSYRLLAVFAALGLSAIVTPTASAEPAPLNGLFALAPGVCSNGAVTGSFFRMILPTGDAGGPYLQNSDSRCSDQTVTPLSAGSDGGLLSGTYQPQPAAAFDAAGNAQSGRVTTPVRFYGVDFATATNPTDPQTGGATGLPELFADGGQLSGDLSSLGVTWNNQVFNQGSPKPGGGLSGKTSPISGSIDGAGNFVIEWTSQIVGGPFNNFTGLWHLAGQYRGGAVPQAAPAAAPLAPSAPSPAAPADAPVAAAAPSVAESVPVALAQPVHTDAVLATKTVEVPRAHHTPVWVVPALLVLAIAAAGVLFNADRIAGRNRQ
ncbi:hypothetical protein OG874_41635 [Nocardia sp. NBC_00565]|uniref:hypothetical protein n=1 Tax=Nocardia sp. NBC_00565 TaxID=2975993 RepID=UPI002E81DF73|nr:hypothetical protein [Nocardia sp. NBC_00565]WUC03110.1 hypothetical protein OG874_41635 [Nocardia sp. NBC_00565]